MITSGKYFKNIQFDIFFSITLFFISSKKFQAKGTMHNFSFSSNKISGECIGILEPGEYKLCFKGLSSTM